MKVDPRRLAAFLQDPGAFRLVLLHGEDAGLVRERSDALVRRVAGSLDDAFRVSELDRDALAYLMERATARPLTGGRGVVRVRDVTDAATTMVALLLARSTEALVVLEAGALASKSKLRALIEASSEAAAIPCYGERGADLASTVSAVLAADGLTAENEAREYLCEHLGEDRGTTRSELAKLALFVHPRTVVTLQDAMAVVGDRAGLEITDALDAATFGDPAKSGRALDMALDDGASPISILRQLLMHLQRFERLRLSMDLGQSAAAAVRAMRPPAHFRRQAALAEAALLWSEEALAEACRAVSVAERDCKQTGSPASVLCRHILLNISRRAHVRRIGPA